MVELGSVRGRAGTWPQGGRAVAWTPPRIPDVSRWLARRVAPWLAAEAAPGRLMPCQLAYPSRGGKGVHNRAQTLVTLSNHCQTGCL